VRDGEPVVEGAAAGVSPGDEVETRPSAP